MRNAGYSTSSTNEIIDSIKTLMGYGLINKVAPNVNHHQMCNGNGAPLGGGFSNFNNAAANNGTNVFNGYQSGSNGFGANLNGLVNAPGPFNGSSSTSSTSSSSSNSSSNSSSSHHMHNSHLHQINNGTGNYGAPFQGQHHPMFPNGSNGSNNNTNNALYNSTNGPINGKIKSFF